MTRPIRQGDLRPLGLAPSRPVAVPSPPCLLHRRHLDRGLALFSALTLALCLPVLACLAAALEAPAPWAALALCLVTPALLPIAGGAASALIGLAAAPERRTPPPGWCPVGGLAILVTLCGEEPQAAAGRVAGLHRGLQAEGLGAIGTIFVLSDTPTGAAAQAEASAFASLIGAGRIRYRRRALNRGRKPGNIAEWFLAHGNRFDTMLVLDADSRMSAARVRAMLHRMAQEPRLGLLQAGLGLVPARTRFGRMQRVSVRLLGPGFGRGFAAWSGKTGSYWGHNALIRTAAFAPVARLPRLAGRAPLGGKILSHDIVEAAFIRRAGWEVVLDPGAAGSVEDGPQTLAAWHGRERRWCQGNLQHARLLAAPGLALASRLHMACGILGYLAGAIWLLLVVLSAAGLLTLHSPLPLAMVATLLMVPKLVGLWRLAGPGSTPWRRRIALRASAGELALSTCLAPTMMVGHTRAVLSVLAGHDCGWKRPERPGRAMPRGWAEAGLGVALAGLAAWTNPAHLPWLAPVFLPLLAAPVLLPALDRPS